MRLNTAIGMKQIIPICVICCMVCLAGCMTRTAVNKDIDTVRRDAYVHWQSTRDMGPQKDDLVIHGELSRGQAVSMALDHSRSLQAAIEERALARGRILESYEGVLPRVSLGGEYTRQDKDHKVYGGQDQPLGQKDNTLMSLNFTQPIYHGGAASAAIRAARYYEVMADEQVRARRQNVIFDTLRAYEDVLLAQRRMDVARSYEKQADAHLKEVKIQRRFGAASDFNVLRAQVDLTTAHTMLLSYLNATHTAVSSLCRTMGISQESRLSLTDHIIYEPVCPVEEQVIQDAFLHRPDLAIARLGERLTKESLSVAYSEYWPSLDAGCSYIYSKPDPYLPVNNEWAEAWNAKVYLSVPLFKGMGRQGRIQQKKAEVKKSHIQYLDTCENILFEVKAAFTDLKDAGQAVEAQQSSLEQATESLRLARAGYRHGTLDQISVLDAQTALKQIRLAWYKSLYTHYIANIRLELAKGTLTPGYKETHKAD
ncbi:MAG: TolC family protein [Thermodesulfobacteriota bacterium]|nr:TolC family protein [Thermodesulfobacteriota bacterium]